MKIPLRHQATWLLLHLAASCAAWAEADSKHDIADMKHVIESLQAEIRALTQRMVDLEAEKAKADSAKDAAAPAENRDQAWLERRVKELEMAKVAQEDAVRAIIKSSVSTLGSKINESVALGGAFEMIAGRSKDFSDASKSSIGLNTAEFDFEIQANDWTLGNIVLEYTDGASAVFPTTAGFDTSVDRINLDTAFVTIGDAQKFPAYVKTGRMIMPFGTSTGVHRADVLSIESPITIEVFESRKNAIGFGLAFPTPALAPPPPPPVVPPVRPQIVKPLVSSLSRLFGYAPPPVRPSPPNYVNAPPPQPPFNAALYFYDGNEAKSTSGNSSPGEHINATLGYRAKGHCGRAYDDLRESWLCPWTMDVDVDYNSSIFDSRFLESEYRKFLPSIGRIAGMAASVKSTLGPFSLVSEWNGATKRAQFLDDVGQQISIKPAAWQVSLGYQFDWNPWVEAIGAQGTFLALGYSESRDLAGVTRVVDSTSSRVGFVPKKRLLLTAGEWVLDGVKLAVEHSRNWDYPVNEGGTGKIASGLFTTLTYTW